MKAEEKIESYLQETRQLLEKEKQNSFFRGAVYAFEKALSILNENGVKKDEK